MCLERHVKHQTYRFVPGIKHHVSISTEQIPEWTSSKMVVVYSVYVIPCSRVCVRKLLDNLIILLNIIGSLGSDVHFHSIHFILNGISQVLPMSDPWERIPAQSKLGKGPFSLYKCHAFSFAFCRVWVRAEFKIMRSSVLFTYGSLPPGMTSH